MEHQWRLGVLGLGEGRSILSAAINSPMWQVAQICDLNEDLCKERMAEFGLTRYTLSYEEMLRDPSVDVIGIYTPDPLHHQHIRMALSAGKHVICTKPLMVSLEGAAELLEAQRQSGKAVMVGQSSRYFEATMKQREDFEAGRHGELVTVETQYISDSRWFLKRDWSHQKGFSWLYNFMIHAVDLAVWYLPRVEEVFAMGVTSANSEEYGIHCPDSLKALFRDEAGHTASVMGGYATPSFKTAVESSISCTLRELGESAEAVRRCSITVNSCRRSRIHRSSTSPKRRTIMIDSGTAAIMRESIRTISSILRGVWIRGSRRNRILQRGFGRWR